MLSSTCALRRASLPLTHLPVLVFPGLYPFDRIGGYAGALVAVDLDLLEPHVGSMGRAADLLGNRGNGCPSGLSAVPGLRDRRTRC